MALTVREQILSAFWAAVSAQARGFKGKARMPSFDFADHEMPAIFQIDQGSRRPDQQLGLASDRVMEIGIGATFRARSDKTLGADISAMIGAIEAAVGLAITQSLELQALADQIQWAGIEEPIVEMEEGAAPEATVVVTYEALYTQAEFDPYQVQ